MSICLSVCPSVCPSVCSSFCPSICSSVCPYVRQPHLGGNMIFSVAIKDRGFYGYFVRKSVGQATKDINVKVFTSC